MNAYSPHPYYSHLPIWLRDTGIIMLLLLQNFVFGISSEVAPDLIGALGILPETSKFIIQGGAIGLVVMLPIYYRFSKFFKKKQLLLGALLMQFVLVLLAQLSDNVVILFIINFLVGVSKCLVLLDCISLLMRRFNPANDRAVFYGFYYTLSKPAAIVAELFLSWFIYRYEWKASVWISVVVLIACTGIVLLLFHNNRLQRRVPLYQVDWIGATCFTTACIALTFLCDFGKYYDWFSSPYIVLASIIFCLSTVGFIYREWRVKRPYFNLKVFATYQQVRVGVILMLVMCLFFYASALNRQYALMLLHNNDWSFTRLSIITAIAYFICFPLTGWLLKKQTSYRLLTICGFALFALSYIYMYFSISSQAGTASLYLFYFLQGLAYSTVLTTLSTYASSNIAAADNPNRVIAVVAVRNVIGLVLAGALWDNLLFRVSAQKRSDLMSNLTNANPTFNDEVNVFARLFENTGQPLQQAQQTAYKYIWNKLETQAFLVADQQLYYYLLIASVVVLICLPFIKQLEMHNNLKKNKYPLV